jgi:hypothetical protein
LQADTPKCAIGFVRTSRCFVRDSRVTTFASTGWKIAASAEERRDALVTRRAGTFERQLAELAASAEEAERRRRIRCRCLIQEDFVINNLGSNISRPTGDLANFVGELTKRADANGDGSLTGSEFAQFLTQLVSTSLRRTRPSRPGIRPRRLRWTPSPGSSRHSRARKASKSALPSIQSALPGGAHLRT